MTLVLMIELLYNCFVIFTVYAFIHLSTKWEMKSLFHTRFLAHLKISLIAIATLSPLHIHTHPPVRVRKAVQFHLC